MFLNGLRKSVLGRQLLVLVLFVSSQRFVGAADPTVTPIADRIELVKFASKAFGGAKQFCVILPAAYTADRADWPVLFLLHGRGRNERSLIDNQLTRKMLLNAPFVIVLPKGEDGWYIDSPTRPQDKYSQLLDETIESATAKYHLSRDPKRRAIAGWSMGGYGCMRYATIHPGQFCLVATMLGLLDFPRTGLPEGQSYKVPVKTFGEDEQIWTSLNPIAAAETLRGTSVLLVTADQAFDRTMNDNMHHRLEELKIDHDWIVLKGDHKITVVEEALPLIIDKFKKLIEAK